MKRTEFIAMLAGVLTAPFIKKKLAKYEPKYYGEQEITVQEYNGTHWVDKWSFKVDGND